MGTTENISNQASQNLANAGRGQMAQDEMRNKAIQADIDRKDAHAKLKMSLEHSAGMQQQMITSNENMQSQRLADAQKGRDATALEAEKDRQFTGQENDRTQKMQLLMQKFANDRSRSIMEFDNDLYKQSSYNFEGGVGPFPAGIGQPQLNRTGGTNSSQGRFPGLNLSPEKWAEYRTNTRKGQIELGKFIDQHDEELLKVQYEGEDLKRAQVGVVSNLIRHRVNTMYQGETMRGVNTAGMAGIWGAGGELGRLVFETDPENRPGMSGWTHSLNKFLGFGLMGGHVDTVPNTSTGTYAYNDIWEDKTKNEQELTPVQVAIGADREKAYSAAHSMAQGWGVSDKEFEVGYELFKRNYRNEKDQPMLSIGETNADSGDTGAGFNKFLAMEIAETMGYGQNIDLDSLRGARQSFGTAKGNPNLLGQPGYGAEEVMAFKLTSPTNMRINIMDSMMKNLRRQGHAKEADVVQKISPLLIELLTTGTEGDEKARKATTDKLVAIFAESKGVGYSSITPMMHKFLDMGQPGAINAEIYNPDTRAAIIASGVRPDDVDKMLDGIKVSRNEMAKLGGLYINLMSAGKAGNLTEEAINSRLQSALNRTDPYTGKITMVEGVPYRDLRPEWLGEWQAQLKQYGAFEGMSPEIEDIHIKALIELVSTADMIRESGEYRAQVAKAEAAEEAKFKFFDETLLPERDRQSDHIRAVDKARFDKMMENRKTQDDNYYNEALDLINTRTSYDP